MSIRTSVTLDEDVLERVKAESKRRGSSFKNTLNELRRRALATSDPVQPPVPFEVKPMSMGQQVPGLNYDDIESLIEYGEGPFHR